MEYILTPSLLVVIPALNVLGLWIKGKKTIDMFGEATYPHSLVKPKFIPLVLFSIAVLVCIATSLTSLELEGWKLILQSVTNGLTQGLICTGVSVFGYDLVKGLKK